MTQSPWKTYTVNDRYWKTCKENWETKDTWKQGRRANFSNKRVNGNKKKPHEGFTEKGLKVDKLIFHDTCDKISDRKDNKKSFFRRLYSRQ
ncbi:hypothetical protein CHS0354_009971 [Potamilus streckersoni]|uniref:Uncharacterized protein n=1 Tax=Potamilus streckersoni TaxID=2493646 RepID=A0AAE0TCA2_9BIVA|nr:hypothetical protein CHS0354_009971 [Potamilus streckersoni]